MWRELCVKSCGMSRASGSSGRVGGKGQRWARKSPSDRYRGVHFSVGGRCLGGGRGVRARVRCACGGRAAAEAEGVQARFRGQGLPLRIRWRGLPRLQGVPSTCQEQTLSLGEGGQGPQGALGLPLRRRRRREASAEDVEEALWPAGQPQARPGRSPQPEGEEDPLRRGRELNRPSDGGPYRSIRRSGRRTSFGRYPNSDLLTPSRWLSHAGGPTGMAPKQSPLGRRVPPDRRAGAAGYWSRSLRPPGSPARWRSRARPCSSPSGCGRVGAGSSSTERFMSSATRCRRWCCRRGARRGSARPAWSARAGARGARRARSAGQLRTGEAPEGGRRFGGARRRGRGPLARGCGADRQRRGHTGVRRPESDNPLRRAGCACKPGCSRVGRSPGPSEDK